jgi:hypothetical protein
MKKHLPLSFRKIFFFVLPFLVLGSTFSISKAAPVIFASPTPKVGTLFDFVVEVLKIVIKIGIPVIAVMFVYTGYLFISAQGNEQQLSKAKMALLSSVVGAAILLGAVLLATIVKNTIGELGG